jgi:hypothetical protein
MNALVEAYREAIGPAADLLLEETAERLNLRPELLPAKRFREFVNELAGAVEHPQLRGIFQSRLRGLTGTERDAPTQQPSSLQGLNSLTPKRI